IHVARPAIHKQLDHALRLRGEMGRSRRQVVNTARLFLIHGSAVQIFAEESCQRGALQPIDGALEKRAPADALFSHCMESLILHVDTFSPQSIYSSAAELMRVWQNSSSAIADGSSTPAG